MSRHRVTFLVALVKATAKRAPTEADASLAGWWLGGYRRNARINGNIKSSSIKNRKPTARTGECGEYRIFSPAW